MAGPHLKRQPRTSGHVTKLKILLYANCDGASAGGVQSVVHQLGLFLARRGHAVSTGWSDGELTGPLIGWSENFPVRKGKRRWFHLPTGARLMWRLLRERPQIVHVHYASPSALYFTTLARWLPFRVILTCHGSDILRPLAHDKTHLEKVLGTADLVTGVTPDIRRRVADERLMPESDVLLVPNGVDTDFWRPPPLERASNPEPVLLAIGRLELVKGHDLLIAACASLIKGGRPVRLVIVGEGSERSNLQRQAEAAGIGDRVTFAGALPAAAIREHLHASDLFVLPSRSEGMPLALLEAQALGVPAVAFDCPTGPAEILTPETGRLVAAGDVDRLAAALVELLQSPELRQRMAFAAIARSRAVFSPMGHLQRWTALVREVAP